MLRAAQFECTDLGSFIARTLRAFFLVRRPVERYNWRTRGLLVLAPQLTTNVRLILIRRRSRPHQSAPLKNTIVAAIQDKNLLNVTCKGLNRTVEPYLIYESKAGDEILHSWQVSGEFDKTPPPDWCNSVWTRLLPRRLLPSTTLNRTQNTTE